jgi:hypothetical protein
VPDAGHLPGAVSHPNRYNLSGPELHAQRAKLPDSARQRYLLRPCLHAKRPQLPDNTRCNL